VELDTRVLQPKGETLVGTNRCLVREGAVTSGGSALTLFLFNDLVMIARRVEHPTLEKFESVQKLPLASVQVADLVGDSVGKLPSRRPCEQYSPSLQSVTSSS
jgi:hypothetical protein